MRSLIHGITTTIGFLLMLATMTFDVGVFVLIMAGFTFGHFAFEAGRADSTSAGGHMHG